jgi:hypothetical protein
LNGGAGQIIFLVSEIQFPPQQGRVVQFNQKPQWANKGSGITVKVQKTQKLQQADAVAPKSKQHAAALKYASEGFRVLPTWPNAKNPFTTNGFKDATTDIQQINHWWSKCPKANVAIYTQDLLVLDLDVKSGINGIAAINELEAEYGDLPRTRTQLTPSGGMHLIFRTYGVTVPSVTNCPKPGIDVRANAGYILAAPSAIFGVEYSMDDTEIADAPDWLVEHLLNLDAGQGDGYREDTYRNEKGGSARICVNLKNAGESVRISSLGQEMTVRLDPQSMSFEVFL